LSITIIILTSVISSFLAGGAVYVICTKTKAGIKRNRKREALQYIAETVREAFFVVSRDWRKIYYLSPSYEKLYGLNIEELYNNPVNLFSVIHPDDREMVLKKTREFNSDYYFDEFPDYRICKPDGSVRWIATRIFPAKDRHGEIIRISGFAVDITEDKLERIEHARLEQLYTSIINNTQDVIYRSDINGKIIMASPSVYKLLGYDPDDNVEGLSLAEDIYYNNSDRDTLLSVLKGKGKVTDYETYLKKKDGSPVIVSTSSHFYYDDEGNIAGVEGVVRDITDRKRAEDLFNKAFFNNPCNMTISEISDGRIIEANNAWLKTLEFERDEVIGHTPSEINIYKNIEDRNRIIESIMKNGFAANLEIDFVSKTGKIQKSLFFSEVVEVAGRKVILSSGINLTEQRAVEESLRESEERFRRLAENAPDVIYRMKLPEGIYEYISPSAERVLGYTPEQVYAKPRLIAEAIHPQWHDYFLEEWNRLLNGSVSPYYEYKIITPEGEEKWLHQRNVMIRDEKGNPAALEGIVTDITERKIIEEELGLKNAILSAEQEVSQDGIIIVDHNGKTLSANKRFTEIWHIPDELIAEGDDNKLLSYAIHLLVNPDDFISKVAYLYEHVDEKSIDEIQFKDGRTVERYSAPVKTGDGAYLGRVWYFRDITERKSAEYKLRESEEKFRRLTESAPIGIFLADAEGLVIYTNPAWQSMTGLSFEQSLGSGWAALIHPDDRDDVIEIWRKSLKEKSPGTSKFRFIKSDNAVITTYTNTVPVIDDYGNVICFVGTNVDITEIEYAQEKLKNLNEELTAANEELMATNEEFEAQNEELIAANYELEHAQKMLRESEKEYRALVENFSAGIIVFNSEREIILSNPSASRILNLACEKMTGVKSGATGLSAWGEDGRLLKHEELPAEIVYNTGKTVNGIVVGLSKSDGKIYKWLLCDAYPEYDSAGKVIKVIAAFIDITERKIAEEEIQTLKNYLGNIIDSIPDMLAGVDAEMNVILINRKTEKASGITMEEAVGTPLHNVLEDFAPVITKMRNAITDKRTYSVPDFLLEKNGEKRYYNLMLYPLITNNIEGAVIRIEDVTDLRRIDEQLRQAQKMETVGNLAGGLAHDFNNVLSGIVGTVSLIKHLMTKDNILNEKFSNYIDIIDRSGKRAAEMVQQLLTLSRRYEVAMKPLDLNNSLRNVMQICHNTFDKSIEIIADFAQGKAIINGDPSQVEQVLLNLCVNASHAMTIMRAPGDKHGGNLSVSIRHIKADVYFCSVHPEAKPGSYWMISHSDTGVGMDEDTLRNIFDPFFTTKERDQGTGLGLAMVYSIIHHHHGFIDVYSERGIGSTFNVYFPEIEEGEETELSGSESVIEKGEGTILVIDDEDIVRLMAENILIECGYNVIAAENGRAGVDLYRNRHNIIDAVLLDMAMPGMSGKEVYAELKNINPEVKVLLASGFRQDYRVDEVMKLGVTGFIQKPYSLSELSRKVKEITKG